MKRAILYILAAVLLVGCQENSRQGELRLEGFGVAVEQEVIKLSAASSKAIEPATDPMEVVVINDAGKEMARYPSHLTMPLTTPLPEGHYTLRVSTSDGYTGAAINKPLYGAVHEFVITAGEVTTVKVVCTETTASVKVEYNDLFKIVFPASKYRYWAELTSSDGEYVNLKDYPNETVFFNVATPDVVVYCKIFMDELQSDGVTWKRIWGVPVLPSEENPNPDPVKEVIYSIPQGSDGLVPANCYVLSVAINLQNS